MIRCMIDTLQLEQAGSACEEAIRLFPRGSERHDMFKTLKLQSHRMKQRCRQHNPVITHEIADWNDGLCFFYTTGMVKEGHPELLSVDLRYPNPRTSRIMKRLKKEKDENGSYPFTLGASIWIKETKQWVSPIPVTVKKQRQQIFKHLMTKTNHKSKVVVLKVDSTSKESRPEPLSKEQAEAYIEEIVKNAPRVQACTIVARSLFLSLSLLLWLSGLFPWERIIDDNYSLTSMLSTGIFFASYYQVNKFMNFTHIL